MSSDKAGRSALDRTEDIIEAARRLARLVGRLDEETFLGDPDAVDSAAFKLLVIGEAANALPEETWRRHPQIPWRNVVGMRNRLVHAYRGSSPHRVWLTATRDVAPLRDAMLAEKAYLDSLRP